MRRLSTIALVALLLATLVMPVFATGSGYAPSIGYKDGPEIDQAEIDRKDPDDDDHDHEKEDAKPCLVITTVIQAQKKETDITQDERDLLLNLYDKMTKDEIGLPQGYDDWVVRELVDISWRYSDCVVPEHGKEEWLEEENTSLTVTLKTGIPIGVEVRVFVFIDGSWVEVEQVTHSDGGLLTCVFEDIGPVAICVEENADIPPAQTGDTMGRILWLWILLLVTSFGALTVLVLNRRKYMA